MSNASESIEDLGQPAAGLAGSEPGGTNSRRPLMSGMARLFIDERNSFSRPKLLFVVAGLDAAMVLACGYLAAYLVSDPATASGPAQVALPTLIQLMVVSFGAVIFLRWNWSYTVAALQSQPGQTVKVARALLLLLLALAGLSYVSGYAIVPASLLNAWMMLAFLGVMVVRVAAESIIARLAEIGVLTRRTVIVGSGGDADELFAELVASDNGHLKILGFFDDRSGDRASVSSASMTKLGTFDQLAKFCQAEEVDLVIVAVPARAEERLLQILQELFALRVDIRISALNAKLRLNAGAYKHIGSVPVLAVMDKPLNDWDRAVKNIEDRVLALAILMLAAPVMAVVALAVRLDSRGPILFRQRRYGFNNQLIEVYKFRSMYVDQSDATASRLVTRDDPRVTRVGRFIRKTSLDELPQLFNVLLGEMSLVGPRPHATQAKAGSSLYQDVVQGYLARHRVKPGITGWAQICGWRGETDTPEKIRNRVACDLYYIDNWSVRFDLYIILLTPFVLASGKNAY